MFPQVYRAIRTLFQMQNELIKKYFFFSDRWITTERSKKFARRYVGHDRAA